MGVYAVWLSDAAKTVGYPVIEVAGWGNRGRPLKACEGVVGHHTATSAKAAGDYPSLKIVRDGRAGLSGPLCNIGLGRSGTIYIVAAGRANHAGVSKWATFDGLNDYFIGIEAESAGDGKWTKEQLDCYPKLVGALLKYMNRPVSRYCSHRACALPSGRKPDPTGISDAWMRTKADEWLRLPVTPPTSGRLLKLTDPLMSGDDVRAVQRKLAAWYRQPASFVDGYYGPATVALVKRAQANTPPLPKLDDDGVCGPLTRKKLGLP